MTHIICLPLDDRPVNYDYPQILAQMAGMSMDLPPREWLGNPWRSSQHQDLIHWLEQAAATVDVAILAIDTLAYGGLIPSRTSSESAADVLARLELLKQLKAARPSLKILASSVILRISRANSAEEEKPYWATYGSRMFRLSYLEHKSALEEASPAECNERDELRVQIPDDVYNDYLQGRSRNHTINRAMLDWSAKGVFDYLLLPQDDTADYGWNIAEARALQGLIRAQNLSERAIIYPGADEIGCLLLARAVCQQAGFAPRIWPRYSSIQGAFSVTAYEDRPVHELLKAHLAPLNGSVAESPEESNLLLFINAPAEGQGAADLQWLIEEQQNASTPHLMNEDEIFRQTRREMTTPNRSPEEFVRAMRVALNTNKPVALADVAFVNGADLSLGRMLMKEDLAPRLAAFGGWNTAGNTLGTVLAHSVIRALMLRKNITPDQQTAHLTFLFLRYLDDYFYQTIVRTQTAYESLPALGLAPTFERLPNEMVARVEAIIQNRLEPHISGLCNLFLQNGLAQDIQITNIHLPWQRLFEIGFDVKVSLP
ncbi:MAG TPA: DUF4127 family protein [Anaerolineales bacterium]|nr:DUF4127 family protein [Anaerolineales bacterium]